MTATAAAEQAQPLLEQPLTVCQLPDELLACLNLYRRAKPTRVLEIGTASGGTLYHWILHAQPGATIVTVDRPDPDYPLDRDRCAGWANDANIELVMVAGDSQHADTIEGVRSLGPFDWVFVDGDHHYEPAKNDVINYGGMLVDGGILLLHDIALKRRYSDGSRAGVRKLWLELRKTAAWAVELRHAPPIDAYGIGAVKAPVTLA